MSLGTDVGYLRELVAYWADEFDWTAVEAELAQLPRFRVAAGGLGIHVVHARAVSDRPALPLILTHGWPDSCWRYTKVIPLLVDPGTQEIGWCAAGIGTRIRCPCAMSRIMGQGQP